MRAAAASAAHGYERLVSLQPQYSLIERRLEYEIGPAAQELGLGIIPWGPLAQGMLSGKYDRAAGPAGDTRMGTARPDWVEHWERRDEERNWRIVDTVGEVARETGKSAAQVALNWLLSRPGVAAPIIGARRVDQLEDNLGAVGWRLDDAHRERLTEVSEPPPVHPYDIIPDAQRTVERP